jgi:hypothetical protein
MPIQPVHQPPYMGKSDQSACKGQAASMLAEKQLPTPQKQSRIQKRPSRRPSGLRNLRTGSACQNLQTPCPWALAICAKAMYSRRHTDRPMGRFRRRK